MSSLTQSPVLPWTIGQSINVDRISMEELKLIFNQAEKRLDSTARQGESIASKTMSLITLMGGLLIALSGYTISIWKGTTALTNKDLAGIFGCLYLLGILIYVINNLMTYKYFEAGSQPETLINSAYFDDEIPRNKMLLLLYLNEIEEYDRRISSNNTLNHQRWRRYKITVFLFLFFPFVLVLLYGALEWFRRGK